MSFLCHATNEIVLNESPVLIPTKIRKVKYVYLMQPNKKSDFLQFVNQSEGWEIVQEVPVRRTHADCFSITNEPKMMSEKEVTVIVPKKKKIISYNNYDDEDYKPEMI